jgi:hypothetical protein
MDLIVIRARYPRALPAKDLEDLAEQLRTISPGAQVDIDDSPDQNPVSSPYAEIVHIILASAAGAALKEVSRVAIDWARKRFAVKKHKRPKTIVLVSPSGEVLSQIEVEDATSKPRIILKNGGS